jgi:alpha-amylase/alpha-mannosidase (GH57 family)
MLKTGERYLTIHGHFYQPPRENPWTGEIEPEYTAHPYANWNERIAHECYQANVNHYARMSFNFAPSLLDWLEKKSPRAYQAILAADQESQTLFGQGSAMAMPYGHLILPLAKERDRKTLILWGIRDFERRFRRKPAGMWLPETAVDLPTLESLAQNGIRFTL